MNDQQLSLDFHDRVRKFREPPMDYINRMFDRHSRSPRRQQQSRSSHPRHSPSRARKQATSLQKHTPGSYGNHKRKRNHPSMTTFNGPSSEDLEAFQKSIQSIPDQHRSSLAIASKDTLEKLCDPEVLHVWETDSDVDNLLQLTSVIAKLCSLGTRTEKGTNANDGCMVIIVEEKAGRSNFVRICQLVEHLTCADRKKHLEGTVAAFGKLVVVKGWNNAVRSGSAGKDAELVVKRVNIAIERVFKMGKFSNGKRKIVWHHGPVVQFLLHWISTTTCNLRSALYAITITGSLDLTGGMKPSTLGRSNTLPDLLCLESYAKKLDIPVVFLDSPSQLITYEYLATYMYYYAYYINTFLPPSLSRPHLHKAQDELVTFSFQLLAASKGEYGSSVVKLVKNNLEASVAQKWARNCIDARNYEKAKCRAASKDQSIHRAIQFADGPFVPFTQYSKLLAFARLCVGPAAPGSMQYHIAAPTQIDFKASRFRLSYPATFHILIPGPTQDCETVTNRIQGLMMAVLERVRQEKGNPVFGDEEKGMWKGVVEACTWALKGAKGNVPKSVEEKVKFVGEKLGKGTWGFAMGAAAAANTGGSGGKGMSDAARANADAVKAHGAGGNSFGQPQVAQGYGMGFSQHQQPMMYAGQQGVTAPPNSPPSMYATPPSYGALPQGYGEQRVDAGIVQNQGVGGAYRSSAQQSGYPQSMGGPWL